ncbi:MAG: ABC-2 family transporter protein [Elusimicrobia bacterium]|nr:ABC-2 family transporter protein [Elusimicrobiota bacterium]
MIRRYWRIWIQMAQMSLQAQLAYPLGSFGFLIGKLMRLFFFFAFVIAIFRHTDTMAGYSLLDMAVFFLTFNLVDMTAQIFFRGIYGARRAVSDGDFDFYLIQPCSPLFRMAFTTVDFLDVATILPVLLMIGIVFARLPAGLGLGRYALYTLLTFNGIGIAMAIHIFVAGLAVRTQELENTIWIYRDIMFMGKFPVDIYGGAARWVLTLVIPIAVMVTFPAKALLGILSPAWTVYALALCAVFLAASLGFWLDSVKRYTSSSS